MRIMVFDKNLFLDSAVIQVSEDSFRITPTHWLRKRHSWSAPWASVVAIEAVLAEPGDIGFIFSFEDRRQSFISEDMQNWPSFLEAVRRKFPGLDWSNFEKAEQSLYTRVPCWKKA